MNAEQLDLARRLAAHPRFEWCAGMLALENPSSGHWQPGDYVWRIVTGAPDVMALLSEGDVHEAPYMPSSFLEAVPDLTDDATGGVLLGMLGPGCSVLRDKRRAGQSDEWTVASGPGGGSGATLAEACARALLAEWGES